MRYVDYGLYPTDYDVYFVENTDAHAYSKYPQVRAPSCQCGERAAWEPMWSADKTALPPLCPNCFKAFCALWVLGE